MHIIVVGCGRVGSQLADFLANEGHDVVVIDKDQRAFRRLGATFNGVTMRGIGFDQDVLKEAGAEKADALAALTNLDNTNMMIAEVATTLFGIPQAVARLYNPEREKTYKKLGLEYVCGTTLVAEKILEKIIKKRISHLSFEGGIGVIEFKAGKKAAGKKVGEIEIPEEFKISAILRDDISLIPTSETVINEDDTLVVTTKEESICKIEKYVKT